MRNSDNILWYSKPAEAWTQALPVGNGTLGAMFFGGIEKETLCLNHDELWTGKPNDYSKMCPDATKVLAEIRKLTAEGKPDEAQELAQEKFHGMWSQSYVPLGNLNLEFSNLDGARNYRRYLNLAEAAGGVEFTRKGVSYKREIFVSNPAKVIAVKMTASKPAIDVTIGFESKLRSCSMIDDELLLVEGECPSEVNDNARKSSHVYYPEAENRGIQFAGAMKAITDGERSTCENKLIIKNASEIILFFTCETSFNGWNKLPFLEGKDYRKPCLDTINAAEDYDEIRKAHIADFGALYSRVTLDLGEGENSALASDKRLVKYKRNKTDLSLITLMYNYGRYLAICSSRPGSQPSTLQGIWNNKICPPWHSNYTVNINTEMNYWPILMTNMPEVNLPLIKMVEELSIAGESTARNMYGAPGFVSHHNVDLWRMCTPVPGNSCWSFWPGSSGWLCRHLYEHYEYTQDIDYLRKTAYPVMKKSAEFYLSQLCEDENGFLIYPAGTSPENNYKFGKDETAIGKCSTMLNSIICDLFDGCCKAAEILGTDAEFKNELQSALLRMLPLSTGKEGQLLEWDGDYEYVEPHHRHVSHLYALHPANIITVDGTPELADACRKTLELRGDNGTGWSLGWKINFWARLFDGDHAHKLIDMQLRPVKSVGFNYRNGGGTYENFFDAHPPFQIDGNFGFVSGVTEMLMQSRDGKIYLLPALPSNWKNGSIKGLLAKGNAVVDIEWKDGALTECRLKGSGKFTLKYNGKSKTVTLNGKDKVIKF